MIIIKKIRQKKGVLKKCLKISISHKVIEFCKKSPKLSALYYFLFNKSLDLVSFKILNARHQFLSSSPGSESVKSSLTSNIHRLEKALCIPNSNHLFATDYIRQTLEYFKINCETSSGDERIIIWSYQVLNQYFSKFNDRPKLAQEIKDFKEICQNLPENIIFSKKDYTPFYLKNLKEMLNNEEELGGDELYDYIVQSRKSVRFYNDSKRVRRSDLIEAAKIAVNSPTSYNRTALKFHFIDKEEDIKKARNIPSGTTCFSEHIPVFAFLIADLSCYGAEVDMVGAPYLDSGLVAANFMNSLETMGLSSCPISWTPSFKKDRHLQEFLELPEYQVCTLCFTIGYADENAKVCYSQRKNVNKATTFK